MCHDAIKRVSPILPLPPVPQEIEPTILPSSTVHYSLGRYLVGGQFGNFLSETVTGDWSNSVPQFLDHNFQRVWTVQLGLSFISDHFIQSFYSVPRSYLVECGVQQVRCYRHLDAHL